jgi:hypothetical protein
MLLVIYIQVRADPPISLVLQYQMMLIRHFHTPIKQAPCGRVQIL